MSLGAKAVCADAVVSLGTTGTVGGGRTFATFGIGGGALTGFSGAAGAFAILAGAVSFGFGVAVVSTFGFGIGLAIGCGAGGGVFAFARTVFTGAVFGLALGFGFGTGVGPANSFGATCKRERILPFGGTSRLPGLASGETVFALMPPSESVLMSTTTPCTA